MADIGKPEKEIVIEPIRLPERHPVPEQEPEPVRKEPKPEKVPA